MAQHLPADDFSDLPTPFSEEGIVPPAPNYQYLTPYQATILAVSLGFSRGALGWNMDDVEYILQQVITAHRILEDITRVFRGELSIDLDQAQQQLLFSSIKPEQRATIEALYTSTWDEMKESELQERDLNPYLLFES